MSGGCANLWRFGKRCCDIVEEEVEGEGEEDMVLWRVGWPDRI